MHHQKDYTVYDAIVFIYSTTTTTTTTLLLLLLLLYILYLILFATVNQMHLISPVISFPFFLIEFCLSASGDWLETIRFSNCDLDIWLKKSKQKCYGSTTTLVCTTTMSDYMTIFSMLNRIKWMYALPFDAWRQKCSHIAFRAIFFRSNWTLR